MDAGLVDKWRVESALLAAGIETYGPKLESLVSSVLAAVDDAGANAGLDDVERIINAHVGPESISVDDLWAILRESDELLYLESEAVTEAETVFETLGASVWELAYEVAAEAWSQRRGELDAIEKLDP